MVKWDRWTRSDGAVVKWDQSSPHPNPADPSSRMWVAYEPDPSERAIGRECGKVRKAQDGSMYRLRVPLRFKSAQAAMRRVDKLFPFTRSIVRYRSSHIHQ